MLQSRIGRKGMTRAELIGLLKEPQKIEEQHIYDLIELSKNYPYCATLHQLVLITLHRMGDLRFSAELQRRILCIPDLGQLFVKLKELPEVTSNLTEKIKNIDEELSSADIISQFLEDHPEDIQEIEMLLDFHPSEALSTLSPLPDEPITVPNNEDTASLIRAFLNKGKEVETLSVSPPVNEVEEASLIYQEEELFTETLARIYIRQGKYSRARKILTQIHLEYPKK